MNGFPITFNIYANNEQEVEELRFVITEFIRLHAEEGRAVTAVKVADALRKGLNIPIFKNRINEYFNG